MRLTASRLELGAACLWWARPGLEVEDTQASPEASLGSAVDAILSAACMGEACDPLGVAQVHGVSIDDVRPLVDAAMAHWAVRKLVFPRTQVSFAYDPITGKARELGAHLARDYSGAADVEVTGTADIIGVRSDRIPVVRDWKTGRAHHVPPILENRQLGFLGLCLARTLGVTEVAIEVTRIRPDGVHDDGAELDALGLAAIEAELSEMHSRRQKAKAKPGGHCVDLWCPALHQCEAAQSEAAALVPVDRLTAQIAADPRRAVEAHRIASKLLDRFDAELKAYADSVGGIPLDDGYEWSARDVHVEAHFRPACVQRRYQRRKVA